MTSVSDRNSTIEGVRFLLAYAVIQSHFYTGLWGLHSALMGWICVDGFLVIAAWFSYLSLQRAWDKSQATTSHIEQAHKILTHSLEYILKRFVPFVWILTLLVIATKIIMPQFYPFDLVQRLFNPKYHPATNFWSVTLHSSDIGIRAFWANPPVWYLAVLNLFFVAAPLCFYAIRLLQKIAFHRILKVGFYVFLPFVLMIANYWMIYWRLPAQVKASAGPHEEKHRFAIQVAPEVYFGKFFISMLAAGLWGQLTTVNVKRSLQWVPIMDIVFLAQIVLYFETPATQRDVMWNLWYICSYLPGNCVFIWAAVNQVGCPGIIGGILQSSFINKVGWQASLWSYLLHVPVLNLISGPPYHKDGCVLGLAVLWIVSITAGTIHIRVMRHYNSLVTKGVRRLRFSSPQKKAMQSAILP
eukprot:Protomagalhaensia_sp_Gyna_25__425@NODE_11_length_8872_cov_78_828031_g7_i0_p3_GENE_NODE_11_length_8872_cov_78_828031_g7_i0NODE_11_length_8872_cov_78_828031_g7_i0_p3_ORF_typecomplete_len413_score15_44Acyl_transf_3/PF01757_22/1e117tm_1/PF00001_21/1_87tm_1/PF00001_21/5_3e02AJAP1_PANP_C/PF15298_6/0_42AJAP1_PANP_C/PF15298_6/6_5e03DUF4199/PF13858_6/1_7e02DUF4199/PF13858_6/8_NODE_11_length_8872_cov_78_828031_g7_i056956933